MSHYRRNGPPEYLSLAVLMGYKAPAGSTEGRRPAEVEESGVPQEVLDFIRQRDEAAKGG